ncbi:MAG: hypothetical protein BMS9Abin11_0934 [Gammaproteobacteria bacterium]|nr:MAG: hypothetical protein BMS9Abin11_0934 [Gammaproteobacteria bacterium]
MDTSLRVGGEHGASIIEGLPVDRNMMFADFKGRPRPRVEKRQRRLLKKIGFIAPFLDEDERILLVTQGCSNTTLLEQLTAGMIVFFLKRALFVVTNKRLFHIPATMDYSYRYSIAQIRFPDCESLNLRGGTLVARYRNGLKDKFLYISRSERKKLKAILSRSPFRGLVSQIMGKQHLCPRCTKGLQIDNFVCPHCGQEFKDRHTGYKYSMLIPGGGYFYTRHPVLGISDAIVEAVLIIFVLIFGVSTLLGEEGTFALFLFFGVILIAEKAVTVFHANHFINEYMPKELPVQPLEKDAK